MNTPTIIIDGKTYELPRLKGSAWRKLMEYEQNHTDAFTADFIENRCEFLADIFGGQFTADVLLDNLYLEDISQAYRDVAAFIISRLSAKLEQAEKNADAGDKTAQSA